VDHPQASVLRASRLFSIHKRGGDLLEFGLSPGPPDRGISDTSTSTAVLIRRIAGILVLAAFLLPSGLLDGLGSLKELGRGADRFLCSFVALGSLVVPVVRTVLAPLSSTFVIGISVLLFPPIS